MQTRIAKLTVILTAAASLLGAQALAQLGIKSVGSVQKKDGPMQVTVVFSEPVDQATAETKSNYSLGAGVTINTVALMTGLPALGEPGNGDDPPGGRVINNQCAVLEVSGLGTTTTTLTVSGVKNAAGTSTLVNATKSFVPSGYSWVDVAQAPYTSPAPGRKVGKVVALSDGGFDIFNNGRTAWGNEDEFTFVYKELTGDFEVMARVEFVDFASEWSRSGLIMRERLDDGTAPSEGCMSRFVTIHSNPKTAWNPDGAGFQAGNNVFESNWRSTDWKDFSANCGGDGSHTDFANDTAGAGGGTPDYPNAWVRLQRAGNTITASYSSDGITWSGNWTRTFADPDLADTLYVGPAYCVEWGNINTANGDAARSRYYLAQVRFDALATPFVRSVTGTPVGFIATIQDAQSKFVKSTLKLWLNDVEVPASSVTGPDANGLSTVVYAAAQALPNNSNNTVKIQFKDDATPTPNTITKVATFTVSYTTLPTDYATTQFSGTKGNMTVNAHQLPSLVTRTPGDANSVANGETELANGYIDPFTGLPYDSIIWTDPIAIDVVNFSDNTAGAQTEAGWFNASNTPDYYDWPMPQGALGDMYAMQFVAFAELKKGAYRMFVNSDDGFKLSVGPNGPDVVGMVLGQFDTGRGMTLNGDPAGFDFVVEQDGVYPLRLSYWEGGGDASVEWYAQDYSTGTRYLINAPVTQSLKTYPEGKGRAYVGKFLPYPGKTGVDQFPSIIIDLVDDLTTVDPASIVLTLDGATLSPTVTVNGKTRTLKWTATTEYALESKHAGQLVYTEKENGKTRTIDYTFTIKGIAVADLPATTFWIEVEDFDYDSGKFTSDGGVAQSTANVMPYAGGAYTGLSAVLDVDYHRSGPGPLNGAALGGYMYRSFGLDGTGWLDEAQTQPSWFVPFYTDTAGIAGQRPDGNTVSVNYRTGWSGGGNWFNYTRTVPKGIYAAYLAAGHWNGDDPATPGQINCGFAKVTAGVGTANQTLQPLGTWYGPGAGLSAADVLTPLKGADGTVAVFKLDGNTTLRLTDQQAGDIDWIALAPQTGVPPKVTQATPANGTVAHRSQPIIVRIEDFSTAAVLNTVKLTLDGQDVTTAANPTKTGDITTMQYAPSPMWAAGSSHTYIVRYSDNSTPPKNYQMTATFTVNAMGAPGQFVIEAEDFNYDTGQTKAAASTMPYLGGAYAGLDAAYNIDYFSQNADQVPSGYTPAYRATTAGANVVTGGRQVCMDPAGDVNRGTWTVTTNFKIGWAGNGAWQNYTRTFPAGIYNVYAALSYGGDTAEHRLMGSFDLVTSGATTTSPTRVTLGSFDAPGTGGWGANALVPMKDASGALATVSLGGAQTVRFNSGTGDMDYFVFAPGAAPLAPSIVTAPVSQEVDAGANVTFTVVAAGTGPLTYQWKFKGGDLAGQTGPSLTINNVQTANAGDYTVTVTGPVAPAVTSPAAMLTIKGGALPEITAIRVNSDKTITIEWTGGGALEATTDLIKGPWTEVATSSPYTFTPQAGMTAIYGRVKR